MKDRAASGSGGGDRVKGREKPVKGRRRRRLKERAASRGDRAIHMDGGTRISINATSAFRGSQRQRERKALFVLARRGAAVAALRKGEKEKIKRRDPELGDGKLVLSELRRT